MFSALFKYNAVQTNNESQRRAVQHPQRSPMPALTVRDGDYQPLLKTISETLQFFQRQEEEELQKERMRRQARLHHHRQSGSREDGETDETEEEGNGASQGPLLTQVSIRGGRSSGGRRVRLMPTAVHFTPNVDGKKKSKTQQPIDSDGDDRVGDDEEIAEDAVNNTTLALATGEDAAEEVDHQDYHEMPQQHHSNGEKNSKKKKHDKSQHQQHHQEVSSAGVGVGGVGVGMVLLTEEMIQEMEKRQRNSPNLLFHQQPTTTTTTKNKAEGVQGKISQDPAVKKKSARNANEESIGDENALHTEAAGATEATSLEATLPAPLVSPPHPLIIGTFVKNDFQAKTTRPSSVSHTDHEDGCERGGGGDEEGEGGDAAMMVNTVVRAPQRLFEFWEARRVDIGRIPLAAALGRRKGAAQTTTTTPAKESAVKRKTRSFDDADAAIDPTSIPLLTPMVTNTVDFSKSVTFTDRVLLSGKASSGASMLWQWAVQMIKAAEAEEAAKHDKEQRNSTLFGSKDKKKNKAFSSPSSGRAASIASPTAVGACPPPPLRHHLSLSSSCVYRTENITVSVAQQCVGERCCFFDAGLLKAMVLTTSSSSTSSSDQQRSVGDVDAHPLLYTDTESDDVYRGCGGGVFVGTIVGSEPCSQIRKALWEMPPRFLLVRVDAIPSSSLGGGDDGGDDDGAVSSPSQSNSSSVRSVYRWVPWHMLYEIGENALGEEEGEEDEDEEDEHLPRPSLGVPSADEVLRTVRREAAASLTEAYRNYCASRDADAGVGVGGGRNKGRGVNHRHATASSCVAATDTTTSSSVDRFVEFLSCGFADVHNLCVPFVRLYGSQVGEEDGDDEDSADKGLTNDDEEEESNHQRRRLPPWARPLNIVQQSVGDDDADADENDNANNGSPLRLLPFGGHHGESLRQFARFTEDDLDGGAIRLFAQQSLLVKQVTSNNKSAVVAVGQKKRSFRRSDGEGRDEEGETDSNAPKKSLSGNSRATIIDVASQNSDSKQTQGGVGRQLSDTFASPPPSRKRENTSTKLVSNSAQPLPKVPSAASATSPQSLQPPHLIPSSPTTATAGSGGGYSTGFYKFVPCLAVDLASPMCGEQRPLVTRMAEALPEVAAAAAASGGGGKRAREDGEKKNDEESITSSPSQIMPPLPPYRFIKKFLLGEACCFFDIDTYKVLDGVIVEVRRGEPIKWGWGERGAEGADAEAGEGDGGASPDDQHSQPSTTRNASSSSPLLPHGLLLVRVAINSHDTASIIKFNRRVEVRRERQQQQRQQRGKSRQPIGSGDPRALSVASSSHTSNVIGAETNHAPTSTTTTTREAMNSSPFRWVDLNALFALPPAVALKKNKKKRKQRDGDGGAAASSADKEGGSEVEGGGGDPAASSPSQPMPVMLIDSSATSDDTTTSSSSLLDEDDSADESYYEKGADDDLVAKIQELRRRREEKEEHRLNRRNVALHNLKVTVRKYCRRAVREDPSLAPLWVLPPLSKMWAKKQAKKGAM